MTAGSVALDEAPPAEGGDLTAFGRALILSTVTLGSTLYSTTILVVSVVLPEMQGTLAATQDQISWAVTFNILATAMFTPMTGWLTARFGRRNVMVWSLAGFTLATFFCGVAGTLEQLVAWRFLQGAFGAPLTPLAQAVVLDIYPRRQHGTVTAIFGMGVVIGPVIGPTLGGYLADLYGWRWAFYMIVPVGVVATIGLWATLPSSEQRRRVRLDWTGFLSLIVAVACLQLMLDRGQRQDWFESPEIIIEAGIAALALYVFIVHSLTAQHPFLEPRLLLDRNYAVGLVIVAVYGMLNFTPMVLLPPLLQDLKDYPNVIVGELLAWRGAGALTGFFLAMYVGKLDPRIGLVAGFLLQAWSGWYMMGFDLNVQYHDVAMASFSQGLAVGLIWVPLVIATFATIDNRHVADTTAVFHLLRNLGSSVFISLSVTTVVRTSSASYARLTEMVHHENELLRLPTTMGGWDMTSEAGLAALGGEIARQAAMTGYLRAFGLYTLASLAVLPIILMVGGRRGRRAGRT